MIGFMGSGKTTTGKALADAMELDFWDMDEIIEDQNATSISEIFQSKGEDHFRKLERQVIDGFEEADLQNVIISTGGGAPCFFDNMDQMNKQGTTIYLEMNLEALFQRLQGEVSTRPLLSDISEEEMTDLIQSMYDKRAPFYQRATYIVDGTKSPQEIVEQILYLINE